MTLSKIARQLGCPTQELVDVLDASGYWPLDRKAIDEDEHDLILGLWLRAGGEERGGDADVERKRRERAAWAN